MEKRSLYIIGGIAGILVVAFWWNRRKRSQANMATAGGVPYIPAGLTSPNAQTYNPYNYDAQGNLVGGYDPYQGYYAASPDLSLIGVPQPVLSQTSTGNPPAAPSWAQAMLAGGVQ